MKYRRSTALFLFILLLAAIAFADDQKTTPSAKPQKISKQTRMELVKLVNAELVYVRSPFPMGRDGLKLKDGVVTPSGADLQQLIGRRLHLVDRTSPYGLTGGVFATDRRAVRDADRALRFAAGNSYINDKPTGALVGQQPFGGSRASGTNFREISPPALKKAISTPPKELLVNCSTTIDSLRN